MTLKTWTTLGIGRETIPVELASQRSSAAHIRRQTKTNIQRDRRLAKRAIRNRRRGSPDRVSKPKPPPIQRKALRGATL